MSKKLDNHFNTKIWKHNYWNKVNKYVSKLRFRIYKASMQKSYVKVHYLQCKLVSSPFAKMLALKTIINYKKEIKTNLFLNFTSGYFRPFHAGYIVNYLEIDKELDLSILLSSNYLNINKYYHILDEVRQLLIAWSLQSQWHTTFFVNDSYLYYLNNINDISVINSVMDLKNQSCVLVTLFDINIIFYALSTHYIISRLDTIYPIRMCISKWINQGRLTDFCNKSSDLVSNLSEDSLFITNLIVLIVVYGMCYENQIILFGTSFSVQLQKLNIDRLIVFNIKNCLLIGSNSYIYLNFWRQNWLMLLVVNGISHRNTLYRKISNLKEGVFLKWYFIFFSKKRLFIRPSLYSQFSLLSNISITTKKIKYRSILVWIIILNKLLIDWSINFIHIDTKKIFCFLDYLIYLKIKLCIRKRNLNCLYSTLYYKYFYQRSYLFNSEFKTSKWVMSERFFSLGYKKTYFLFKLSWLK